jgi:anaerobic magnesium-protoporphyrin IX monomethyl ester cyclase
MFYDDEINLNKIYFENLLSALIKYQEDNNVQFNFRGYTRSDLFNNEQANLMYKAGFKWLLVGFESGSDKILKNIDKGCTVEDNTNVFEIARKNNLKIKALMSIGHPGETHETINETINWLKKVKPEETDTTIVAIYPGSYYFDKSILIDKDLLLYKNEKTKDSLYIKNVDFLSKSNFYKSKSDEYVSFIYTDDLSDKEIVKQRLLIENEVKKY